jgi:hypothetical protein
MGRWWALGVGMVANGLFGSGIGGSRDVFCLGTERRGAS